eukprot:bmy_19594T0
MPQFGNLKKQLYQNSFKEEKVKVWGPAFRERQSTGGYGEGCLTDIISDRTDKKAALQTCY